MGKRLFVGNLSFDTTDADLRDLFSGIGTCTSASVLSDRMTGRSRGFGFVEMSTDDEAQRAISQLNDTEFQGRRINVSEARERTGPGLAVRSGPPNRSFGPDLPPAGPKFRKKGGGSRRGIRARKRSL
jgi:RNA recognition motif-containing protein